MFKIDTCCTPASEIEKLREQLASLNPQFFVLDEGIRRTSEA